MRMFSYCWTSDIVIDSNSRGVGRVPMDEYVSLKNAF